MGRLMYHNVVGFGRDDKDYITYSCRYFIANVYHFFLLSLYSHTYLYVYVYIQIFLLCTLYVCMFVRTVYLVSDYSNNPSGTYTHTLWSCEYYFSNFFLVKFECNSLTHWVFSEIWFGLFDLVFDELN